ncbi:MULTISPECIES: hypothetical protein [unclassified Streptomyces]|uniref:hypothetical protein n=1 Tax=unclassified Streptomyces TaxID=2593676 RepID=UPI0035DBEE00
MNALKRTLAALVVSGGALALVPAAAHADEAPDQAPPVVGRVVDIVDHPTQAVQDTKTAVGATAQATDSSLKGAGTALTAGLPNAPKVG